MDNKIFDQVIYILIDPGSNYSYVNTNLVHKCVLRKEVHAKSWLVQLVTGSKKIVHHCVRSCAFKLNGMPITTNLNVMPPEYYSMVLGMDWLHLHRTKLDCYDKAIECRDDNGEKIIL